VLVALVLIAIPAGAWALSLGGGKLSRVTPSHAPAGTSGLVITMKMGGGGIFGSGGPPPPPAGIPPMMVTIGTVAARHVSHPSSDTIVAVFDIAATEVQGNKDAAVVFSTPQGTLTYTKERAFRVDAPLPGMPVLVAEPQPLSRCEGASAVFRVSATANGELQYQWQKDGVDLAGVTTPELVLGPLLPGDAGKYRAIVRNGPRQVMTGAAELVVAAGSCVGASPVVGTGQDRCYDLHGPIACDAAGTFGGQDAEHRGHDASYALSTDGLTVHDAVTGLDWVKLPDLDGNGRLDARDKVSWTDAAAGAAKLNARNFGGFSDWRLPSIEALYSLMDFDGEDVSGYTGRDTSWLKPFLDTRFFDFIYGAGTEKERVIDAQYWSSTRYVGDSNDDKTFGVNFADGRIKGYPAAFAKHFVRYVRGNAAYGIGEYRDNGDGTVTDAGSGLQWEKGDSRAGMDWPGALAFARDANARNFLGHSDWRLPDAKELQSLLDYDRSPDTTDSAAIDPAFDATVIRDEAGQRNFPCYWSSTTHLGSPERGVQLAEHAVYVCFGEAMGYWGGASAVDVHGAGAQRSDPKVGKASSYPRGHGPQGDVVRIDHYVRLVRDAG
jgi:hypothetical protein